jgi:hypothetical protein
MTSRIWDDMIDAARAVYETDVRLSAFCPFPDDLPHQEVTPLPRTFLEG